MAPCPWLYRDLGQRIWADLGGSVREDHPYADWIRRYEWMFWKQTWTQQEWPV